MSNRWSINITPAERVARVAIGGLAAIAGAFLLGGAAVHLGGRSSSCYSYWQASTWSSPERSDTARSTPSSATCPHP